MNGTEKCKYTTCKQNVANLLYLLVKKPLTFWLIFKHQLSKIRQQLKDFEVVRPESTMTKVGAVWFLPAYIWLWTPLPVCIYLTKCIFCRKSYLWHYDLPFSDHTGQNPLENIRNCKNESGRKFTEDKQIQLVYTPSRKFATIWCIVDHQDVIFEQRNIYFLHVLKFAKISSIVDEIERPAGLFYYSYFLLQ